jgi:DNA-directed RNA polymerase subunit RPC12/RpoP
MSLRCPYCKGKLIFKERKIPRVKGWGNLGMKKFVKKCKFCGSSFKIFYDLDKKKIIKIEKMV